MYNAFFQFSESPFNLSPDPRFLYRSPQREEALANLIYGVQTRKGFIVLTGDAGTGKTTLLECLREFLNAQHIAFASLFNSRLTPDQFFEMLAYDFELSCDRTSKTEILFALNELLLQQAEGGSTAALIVDEAHNLEPDVLEEVRLLDNLENSGGKLLQIVLAGQTELDRKLETPDLRQLKQRIVLRCHLDAFTEADTDLYIRARLERAGMPDQVVFRPGIVAGIHHRSEGIPRLINSLCDNLLLTAFAKDSRVVTEEMLDEVGQDMHLELPNRRHAVATHPVF
jgi:general secretion pathway protein A